MRVVSDTICALKFASTASERPRRRASRKASPMPRKRAASVRRQKKLACSLEGCKLSAANAPVVSVTSVESVFAATVGRVVSTGKAASPGPIRGMYAPRKSARPPAKTG